MYHNIANNTFSYLLTLDEFRQKYDEEIKPSWIKITTITMVSKYMHDIDIPKLKEIFKNKTINVDMENSKEKNTFKWTVKPTTFYNQITLVYIDDFSTKSIKVFPNGSLQVAGCSDLFDCKRIISELCTLFEKYLGTTSVAPIDTFRVVMVNSNYFSQLVDDRWLSIRTQLSETNFNSISHCWTFKYFIFCDSLFFLWLNNHNIITYNFIIIFYYNFFHRF